MLSGVADVPIAMGFLFIGVLLAVFYQLHPDPGLPTKNPEVFAYYILHQLPPGARGLLIAGVLATAMGSLSTALNALATSFTQDFWVPRWGQKASPGRTVAAVRWGTVVFALLLALVGTVTAAVVVYSPHARIIPVVLGIFGYTYGSLLGIFLLGLTTKTRGTDRGNLLAMAAGFVGVAILSGLPWDLLTAVRGQKRSAAGLAATDRISLAGDVRDDHHLRGGVVLPRWAGKEKLTLFLGIKDRVDLLIGRAGRNDVKCGVALLLDPVAVLQIDETTVVPVVMGDESGVVAVHVRHLLALDFPIVVGHVPRPQFPIARGLRPDIAFGIGRGVDGGGVLWTQG